MQRFLKILWRKLRLRASLLLVLFQFFGGTGGREERGWALIWVSVRVGGKWDGDGRLFEAGSLLTCSAFRMGTYSRWALIRGWALIRINTVIDKEVGYVSSYMTLENLTDYWHLPWVLLSTAKGLDSPLFSSKPIFKALNSIVPLFSSDNVINCAFLGVMLAARRLSVLFR